MTLTLDQMEGFAKKDLQDAYQTKIKQATACRALAKELMAEADTLLELAGKSVAHKEWAKFHQELKYATREAFASSRPPRLFRRLHPMVEEILVELELAVKEGRSNDPADIAYVEAGCPRYEDGITLDVGEEDAGTPK
jgi:hypothetical protein